ENVRDGPSATCGNIGTARIRQIRSRDTTRISPPESGSSINRQGLSGSAAISLYCNLSELDHHPVCAAKDASRHFYIAHPPLLGEEGNLGNSQPLNEHAPYSA